MLYIQTWEEDRILYLIHETVKAPELIKTVRNVFRWRITTGLTDENGKSLTECACPQKTALNALDYIMNYDDAAVFILHDFHVFFGGQGRAADPIVIRKLRDMVSVIKNSLKPKNIIFVSPIVELPNDLQKDVTIVDFNLPSFEEILNVLNQMIAMNEVSGSIKVNLNDLQKEKLAKAALGLTISEAENAFARAMVDDGVLDESDLEIIYEEKEQIIKKSGILEFVRSNLKMEDVGGLENIKKWLQKRNNSWLDAAKEYGLPAPKGVLITGVPGAGKSLISKAISTGWQLPLLRLDMGKVFSGIVGSSENNMRKAIQTAEAIAPSVLWIDELEKGFSGLSGQGDSGTSSRIFGQFLTWMQEKTAPVFVVATANNISGLPPELMRKGRFDEIFFVDLPTFNERKKIYEVHIKKRLKSDAVVGDFELNDEVLNVLAEKSEGFVGAEIEQLVIEGLFEAFSNERSIQLDDFVKAIQNTVPLSITQVEQIQAIREWANVRAVAATPKEDMESYKHQEPEVDNSDDKGEPAQDLYAFRGGRSIDF